MAGGCVPYIVKRMKNLLPLLLVLFLLPTAKGQTAVDSLTRDTLRDAELRLSGLGDNMIHSVDEETRITSAIHFIRLLGRTLRIPASYSYPFDSLKMISILHAPDDMFRIMTWNIATNDENFRYFGVIQMNPEKMKRIKDKTNLRPYYPLIDRSDSVAQPFSTTLDQDHWWGANYYKIIRTTSQKDIYYTLLGWDGATKKSNKKVVDVLTFKDNKPVFGAPVFDIKTKRILYRMIWEFSDKATMTLRYEDKKKVLIYENVVPPNVNQTGMFETYIPDGSYDYMIWKNGKWEKQPDMVKDFKME
jgi:hypothetical protein